MPTLDVNKLLRSIVASEAAALRRDAADLEGFARDQATALAQQAKLVAAALASGHLDADEQAFWLDNLKELARNYAETLAGLIAIDVEKAWNTAVKAVWDAVGTAAGLALPKPF